MTTVIRSPEGATVIRGGQGPAAPPLSAARLAAAGGLVADRRNTVVLIGDSRNADYNQASSVHPISWVNATRNRPLRVLANYAVGGTRTDQMLASQLQSALAAKSRFVAIWSGTNDITQQYPDANTCGATAAANIITACEAVLAAGATPLVFGETGTTDYNSNQIKQFFKLRETIADYAARKPAVVLSDHFPFVMDPTSTPGLDFRTGAFRDSTHFGPLAGYLASKCLGPLLDRLGCNEVARNLCSVLEPVSANNTPNPLFTTTTGGTAGTGVTGSVPAGYSVVRGAGSPTAVCSVSAVNDKYGNPMGNELVVAVTFAAAGNIIDVKPTISFPTAGPLISSAVVSVDAGASNLLGNPYLEADTNSPTQGFRPYYDMYPGYSLNAFGVYDYGPTEAYELNLQTEYTLPSDFSAHTAMVRIAGRAAGSATVRIRQFQPSRPAY